MRAATKDAATTHARREPVALRRLSAAARRSIRQRVALATELNLHSVAAAGSVWTLRHAEPRPAKLPKEEDQGSAHASSARKEKEKQRSKERAAAHRARCARVDAFRVAAAFKQWCSQDSNSTTAATTVVAPPLPPTLPPPPPPPPAPETQLPSPPPQQQPREPMDEDRGAVRMRSPPEHGASPIVPHAQRVRRELTLPPPPPSIPPSPPSSTPPLSTPTSSHTSTPPKGETTPGHGRNKQCAEGASSRGPAHDGVASSVPLVSRTDLRAICVPWELPWDLQCQQCGCDLAAASRQLGWRRPDVAAWRRGADKQWRCAQCFRAYRAQ